MAFESCFTQFIACPLLILVCCGLNSKEMGWMPLLLSVGIAIEKLAVSKHSLRETASMNEAAIIGVDLAKNVFQLQGAAADGRGLRVPQEAVAHAVRTVHGGASAVHRRDRGLRCRVSLGPGNGGPGFGAGWFIKLLVSVETDFDAIIEGSPRTTIRMINDATIAGENVGPQSLSLRQLTSSNGSPLPQRSLRSPRSARSCGGAVDCGHA